MNLSEYEKSLVVCTACAVGSGRCVHVGRCGCGSSVIWVCRVSLRGDLSGEDCDLGTASAGGIRGARRRAWSLRSRRTTAIDVRVFWTVSLVPDDVCRFHRCVGRGHGVVRCLQHFLSRVLMASDVGGVNVRI